MQLRRHRPVSSMLRRTFTTHEKQMRILENGLSSVRHVTYPDSDIISPRSFYQTAVADWAKMPQRPVSLRQLAFFGRKLTPAKLLMSANYVREELTIRVAHRVLDMQKLPYKMVSNKHLTSLYERYLRGFEKLRRIRKIENMDENDEFCDVIATLLDDNGRAVPELLLGVLELVRVGAVSDPNFIDAFVRSMLSSRISRRVLAEQHLSLSRAFKAGITNDDKDQDYIGEVLLQQSTVSAVTRATDRIHTALAKAYPNMPLPAVVQEGNPATFPYIQSHLDYIIGEVLRNSLIASQNLYIRQNDSLTHPPPVLVSVSSTKENIFIRVSDQGGGIPPEALSSIWSFAKPRMQEDITQDKLELVWVDESADRQSLHSTLQQFSDRDPSTRLGIGLAMSRVYTEYWDGALEVHSIENYGCDVLLRISRLGTKLENLHLNRV